MNNSLQNETEARWEQGQLLDIEITDLSDTGDGVGRSDSRVVFVPDTAIGDRVRVRLMRVKPQYAQGRLLEILQPSATRVRPGCIVADKCGGCQWQHIDYPDQLAAKQNQILQALARIGGFKDTNILPILPSVEALGYRNKSTYPLTRSSTGQVQAGYYQKGSHQLINLNQCPVQDSRLNPLLSEVKHDIQQRGWSIYDETHHRGRLRHLSLRIGRRTGEMLLTLVIKEGNLGGLEEQAQAWLNRYPDLVGVWINYNPDRTNAIFGAQTRLVAGQPYLREEFGGLEFHLRPDTFFQVNTEAAEAMLSAIATHLNLQGNEVLVDAYCGIGTFTLPLAKRVQQAIGLEVQAASVEQAIANAETNQIQNVSFQTGAVETLLPQLGMTPDIILVDPPRKGCDRAVLDALLNVSPNRIVYISCKPATLARDLKILCENQYQLTHLQPADFFPQTSHVECAAFLTKIGFEG